MALLAGWTGMAGARVEVPIERGPAFVPRLVIQFRPEARRLPPEQRVAQLASETGIALVWRRTLGTGADLVSSPAIGTIDEADAMASMLSRHPQVAVAERTHRVHAARVANDPLFQNQFYLQPGPASIDAPSAWDVTVGSPAIVVAVLDTGSTAHADLAGRLLSGYDFVSPQILSNDGGAPDALGSYRDADASDPGDWVSVTDVSGPLADTDCTARASSWHGTSVLGAIGAAADNGRYLTGVDWRAQLLPVRVLGKCYGEDADVADAIVWAAGLAVPGVPANLTPANVINLSLGDPGPCPKFMQDAIDAALRHGITRAIVAAAGNQDDGGDHFPAGCTGVIAVAASASSGAKASYSNWGPRIDIAAPGGNGNGNAATNFLALFNAGATVPEADSTASRAGTSFAAPLVSGVASLVLSVAPGLSAATLRDLLKGTAKPFPASSNCPTLGCGTGIVDAGAAVRGAMATNGGSLRATVVEYYNAALDHYFMTWAPDEILLLDTGVALKGWRRTGMSFEVLLTPALGTSGVCRIYIPPGLGDGHYFGRDAGECARTLGKNPSFVDESPSFFYLFATAAGACPAATLPVYRVYSNRADANHRYTTDRSVRDGMAARGWLVEGDGDDRVVMCTPAPV
ncbi:MAG: S8 family serine peptidase [Burkholderiales bacterium]